ncbi:kinesin-like protein KIN-14L isoform X1 [Chenopodium quinoa]|uniref:kinesin-like protein KIN-14L isoform X1 n=2 Tax=Chenopodium quinoa TaxID=63459 RepID=UPI000B7740E5|nr:kinesin-like protein KIN-14L isoform X1 [Chenopodium quinoa]
MGIMAEIRRSGELHDFHLASRRAEELALRRYKAVHWLECTVGPLGIHSEPSDREFISCLRNGIILCKVINKIQPGCIPKVVDSNELVASESAIWDSKPLPAYQYFENVRNFLMAVKELKLPAFEASDLENFETGSAARIADCILALKSYYEWKEWSGGNGVYKHVTAKSPLVLQSAAKNFSRPSSAISAQSCRQLDLSAVDEKQSLTDSIVKALTNGMVDSKENIDDNFLTSYQNGSQDPIQLFKEILSRCLEEKLGNKFPMLKSCSQENLQEAGRSHASVSILKENSSLIHNPEPLQCHRAQTRKGSRDHRRILRNQERDLSDIKALWYKTKGDFEDLQSQMSNDLMHLESLIEEMSGPALGYEKVIKENRKLYNMAQDLKGYVRVYCRIRPILNTEAKNVVDFVGQDGSLVIVDPSKPRHDGRKIFRFNQLYGPTSTQDELFKEIQPLIRSVMDGYNVCILAYGQTGSGKTHTMYGTSGVSEKDMGINFFALNDLFQIAERRQETNYDVRVQMIGICNEEIQDLLAEDPASDSESSLPDVTFHSVKSNVDAINLVKLGERKHASVNTSKMNNISSPCHSAVAIHVHGKDTSGNIIRGCLHLVDLAASGEDDKSLSCLEDVITSFSQKSSNNHQGNSKITSLLQDALGGNAKVVVLTHVIPEGDNFTETIRTLKFAQKISTIELGAVQSNKTNIEVMQLKEELEILKSALGDKDPKSPLPNRQLRSPCDKTRAAIEKSPVKARRLSMENPGSMKSERLEKSPLKQLKISAEKPDNLSDPTAGRSKEPKSPLGKPMLEGSFPRPRRLSIENPMAVKSENKQKLKEPKTPSEGKTTLKKQTPPRTRRLSIENSSSVKPVADIRKSTKTPQSSIRARRLSLEGPKNRTKKGMLSADVVSSKDYISITEFPKSPPPATHTNGLTFTDCATKYPTIQPPKTPERQKLDLNEMQPPSVAKSTNKKGSQIKRSLRTIGKLINGSEKRSQQVVESSSIKGKDNAREPRSPSTAKARTVRRQSLTGIPPGSNRRSSLGGISTDARPNDNRNAKTPPPVRSSMKITNRWM